MTEELARRGLRVHADFEVDVLRTSTVGGLMSVHAVPSALGNGETSVHVDEVALDAVRRMLAEHVDRFAVVDDAGAVVGVCTTADIVKARAGRFEHEHLQPGGSRAGVNPCGTRFGEPCRELPAERCWWPRS